MQCVICLTEPAPITPCVCRVAFCPRCYQQYQQYQFVHCPMCRRAGAQMRFTAQLYTALSALFLHVLNTRAEEAQYAAVIALLGPEHLAARATADAHHAECRRRSLLANLMTGWCFIWMIVLTGTLFNRPNNWVDFIPCGIYGVWLIVKTICQNAYAERMNLARGFIECFLTGVCLFYTAIRWNNSYMILCIILWCSNSLGVLFMTAAWL
jgi:hypothetical protein